MALDTFNDRASCLNLAMPFLGRILPLPDADIDDADKRQLAYCYRGDAGTDVEPPITPGLFWPAILPPFPERPGFLEESPSGAVRSGLQGLPAMRARSKAAARALTVPFRMTRAQVETLDQFYDITCAGGALAFAWVHPRTQATAMLRFTAKPTYRALAYDAWDVDCAMEVLPS